MRLTFLFWIIISLLSSCKEDRDKIPPSIIISSPIENLNVSFSDEIVVKASISDNEIIRSVQLSLISTETKNRILRTESFQPNSSTFELTEVYEISDSLLAGGEYYFKVEAKDDDNTFAAFRFININSFPQRKISCIVSCSDLNNTTVYEDRNDFSFQKIHDFSSPYLSSELNSYDQHYWYFPSKGNQLQTLDLRSKSILFSESFISNRNDFFGASALADRHIFISTKAGELQGYNPLFQDNYTYLSASQKQLGKVTIGEQFILQDEGFSSGNNQTITVLYRTSGNVKIQFSISHPIEESFFLEDNVALLFQNDQNGGLIQELKIEDGGIRKIRNTRDSILSVEQISKNEYLISTRDKIERYTVNPNNLVDYLSLERAVVQYDRLNNQLYIGSGKTLSLFNNRQLTSIQTIDFQTPIKGIDLRYNY